MAKYELSDVQVKNLVNLIMGASIKGKDAPVIINLLSVFREALDVKKDKEVVVEK